LRKIKDRKGGNMSLDIPSQIKFEHLLSFTFPGFFSAVSIFMAVDYLSEMNLTSMIAKDVTSMVSFLGLVILFGTVLGILIDGIHHAIIEDELFDRTGEINRIKDKYKKEIKVTKKKIKVTKKKIKVTKKKLDVPSLIALDNHILGRTYCFSEFFSNISISLVIFSYIIPFYLLDAFNINWQYSWKFGFAAFLMAIVSLFSGYKAYVEYNKDVCKYNLYFA